MEKFPASPGGTSMPWTQPLQSPGQWRSWAGEREGRRGVGVGAKDRERVDESPAWQAGSLPLSHLGQSGVTHEALYR